MNATQRKFAVAVIYTSLSEKMKVIEKEDAAQLDAYFAAKSMPVEEIKKRILSRSLPVLKKLDGQLNEVQPDNLKISHFFDMDKANKPYEKMAVKLAPTISIDNYRNAKIVRVDNTLNNNDSVHCYFRYQVNFDRAEKIKAELANVTKQVMLAGNEEALAAITRIESMTF